MGSSVIVLKPNDVIFTQILTVLNFNQDQRNHAGIFQTVRGVRAGT